jgi:hypothetical protein
MNLKTDPIRAIALNRNNVERMQRGCRSPGIHTGLDRRKAESGEGAPLLTAHDEFVGQGCGGS